MNRNDKYGWARKKIRAQVLRHINTVSTLANTAAILKDSLNFFWVGFYFVKKDHLLLGPFQGSPACVKLNLEKGVCAECAKQNRTIIVENVHEFPGHVACDERSKSEIVVPVRDHQNQIKAVLDIDSDAFNDFNRQDEEDLEKITELLKSIWKGKVT
ncbi:GAF domain-containing protein [candidate division KSB1 bacterium]|nr:GAF domain-containing protein [candidate division KSB1 bacterium]